VLLFFRKLKHAFRHAGNGIIEAFRSQINFRIHCLAAGAVSIAGIMLHIKPIEWIAIIFCIGFVLAAELVNTALESLCDKLHPEHDPKIGRVKDLGAAAVLTSAITALLVACWIFGKYVF
jgi:diacylglycerol kinase